jgi:exonuclease VII small subunit
MPKKTIGENKTKELLKSLENITEWFEAREDVDLDVALEKLKEGAELIKVLKEKLKYAENEFKEIKKSVLENE